MIASVVLIKWSEEQATAWPAGQDKTLRRLARRHAAAARKAPPGGHLGRPADGQNQLDVAADAEVVSKRP